MVNQAFRIKIAYRSEKEEEEKIPGIGRYPMGPTKIQNREQEMQMRTICTLTPQWKICNIRNNETDLVIVDGESE